ncbi:hypothetical protein GUJ93_ZPchr0009g1723 [Zizania palustris]|uniref:Uncharacterized protein n=1 Tax=Zizania palustris TaxID=103762 RepID=A0A8J5RKE1_ZIZPA|nr:hypothetical protein GUJ93_ZPchr0009g1723 [Zizania palustris]
MPHHHKEAPVLARPPHLCHERLHHGLVVVLRAPHTHSLAVQSPFHPRMLIISPSSKLNELQGQEQVVSTCYGVGGEGLHCEARGFEIVDWGFGGGTGGHDGGLQHGGGRLRLGALGGCGASGRGERGGKGQWGRWWEASVWGREASRRAAEPLGRGSRGLRGFGEGPPVGGSGTGAVGFGVGTGHDGALRRGDGRLRGAAEPAATGSRRRWGFGVGAGVGVGGGRLRRRWVAPW